MQAIQRLGRIATVVAAAVALTACVAYPQGTYQNSYPMPQGGYQGTVYQGAHSGSGFPGAAHEGRRAGGRLRAVDRLCPPRTVTRCHARRAGAVRAPAERAGPGPTVGGAGARGGTGIAVPGRRPRPTGATHPSGHGGARHLVGHPPPAQRTRLQAARGFGRRRGIPALSLRARATRPARRPDRFSLLPPA